MDNFAEFLETFICRDREAERRREQDYIELIRLIRSELNEISKHGQFADLEEVD
jgi:hypothetical protein